MTFMYDILMQPATNWTLRSRTSPVCRVVCYVYTISRSMYTIISHKAYRRYMHDAASAAAGQAGAG